MQEDAVRQLLSSRNLIVNWGTGVGKSRVAIVAADLLERNGLDRILLVVTETAHKTNWKNEFNEVLGAERASTLLPKIRIECYASLFKYEGTAWDLIIFDEAHHLRSELRTDHLAQIFSSYVLCLSATISEKHDGELLLQTLEESFGHFESISFTMQQAIDSNILGKPDIYVHVFSLDNTVRNRSFVYERGFPKARKVLECSFDQLDYMLSSGPSALKLTVHCTEKEGYDFITSMIDKCKSDYMAARDEANLGNSNEETKDTLFLKNRWLLWGSKRKNFLGAAKSEKADELLSSLGEKKFICFCSDVEQGKKLGGDNVIHSKRKGNAAVIEAFNEDRIRSIYAVGMIQEGQNLKGIKAGVIVQLGGKERVFIQKFGRVMRSSVPEQHLMVFNKTKDIDYLKTALDGIDKKYIHYVRKDLA